MNINLNSNVGVSAKWQMEICTPTATGIISEFPFGTGYRSNAILNYFLSGIILHLYSASPPSFFVPSYFTDGAIQLGTGVSPISYTDRYLHKFYQESNFIRPFANSININYVTGSGIAFFEKTYEFPSVPGTVKFTEAAFKHIGASSLWSKYGISNPIYSRFLFTQETPFTGYISGVLNDNGTFSTLNHPLDQISGVFAISGDRLGQQHIRQYQINPPITKRENITGFLSGYRNQFGSFSSISSNGASGYFLSGQRYQFPPYSILSGANINGYISGTMTELSGFIPYTGDGLDSSGYYLNGIQYEFQEPFSEFSGLSGFENGYNYYGFDFLYGSGFVSEIPGESYGNGKLTGIIGARNIQTDSGSFQGFSDLSGFEDRLGYSFFKFFSGGSGFVFDSGVQTFNGQLFGSGIMTGIIGYRNIFTRTNSGINIIPTHEYGWYTTKSGIFGESGVNISNNVYSGIYTSATGFSGSTFYNTEFVNGFISGSMNEFGIFSPLANINNISGYIYSGQTFYFSTGGIFSGFSGNSVFSGKQAIFSGFFVGTPAFSGLDNLATGSGILSGNIGIVNTPYISNKTGILTGIAGYKKYISGITLDFGQYVKMKYQIAFRIPQYAEPTIVSGDSISYGDFNGSGQLKFLGVKEQAFGQMYEDNISSSIINGTTKSSSEGIWWPVIGFTDYQNAPNLGLSASMLKYDESLQYNPSFPEIDKRPFFNTVTGHPEQVEGSITYMKDPLVRYPSKNYNTLSGIYTGGYELSNLFVFKGEFPNFDVDIGGIWFSFTAFSRRVVNGALEQRYSKPQSGNCGWMYKFDTPQRKWEDQGLYVTTKLIIERDQFFEDPYYGRYPQ